MTPKHFTAIHSWRVMTPDSQLWTQHPDQLNELLETQSAGTPGPGQIERSGFLSPFSDGDRIPQLNDAGAVTPLRLLCFNVSKRIIPAKVVKQEVTRRAAKMAEEEHRRITARDKQRIKEDVLGVMIPDAWVEHKQVYALVSEPYIFIGTSSARVAEDLLNKLRMALGSLPVRPVASKATPISGFSRWFSAGEVDDSQHLILGDKFLLQDKGTGKQKIAGTWEDNRVELEEIVNSGQAQVTALGLHYVPGNAQRVVPFEVTSMLGVKGIKWPPELTDRIEEHLGERHADQEDEAAQAREYAQTSLYITHELWRDMLTALLKALDGEAVPESRNDDNLI